MNKIVVTGIVLARVIADKLDTLDSDECKLISQSVLRHAARRETETLALVGGWQGPAQTIFDLMQAHLTQWAVHYDLIH